MIKVCLFANLKKKRTPRKFMKLHSCPKLVNLDYLKDKLEEEENQRSDSSTMEIK